MKILWVELSSETNDVLLRHQDPAITATITHHEVPKVDPWLGQFMNPMETTLVH